MENKEVTREDIEQALRRAICHIEGAKERWDERIASGLTDEELEQALKYELGIAGGQCGPDTLSIDYQRSGFKIWASWGITNTYSDAPVLEGRKTIAMTRKIYAIRDPADQQMSFL